ncbi:MAG TPA: S8 family serine peptidase [Pirellulaceae bacterium]|jgi:subtilisin family serine protease|nr:S8 family serine peptidase [Pirellulaceae bacterium]
MRRELRLVVRTLLRVGLAALCFAPQIALAQAPDDVPFAPVEDVIEFEPGEFRGQLVESSDLLQATQARAKYGVDGTGLVVAVLDSGINTGHVDFAGKIVGGLNYTTDYNSDPNNFTDGHGHGSNCAGIVMAKGTITRGIAPGANVFVYKVLRNTNSGSFAGMRDALIHLRDNRVTLGVTAVNMSIGDGGNHQVEPTSNATLNEIRALIDELRAAGVVFCVSAGNSFGIYNSVQGMGFPAICRSATSAGAVFDADIGYRSYNSNATAYTTGPKRITPFSQRIHSSLSSTLRTDMFATGASLTAPGHSSPTILSSYHGTSQASPCVAGVAMLMQEYHKKRTGTLPTVDQIENWMRLSAEGIVDGDDEDDNVVNTGQVYPLVNALAALELIEEATNQSPTIDTTLLSGGLHTALVGSAFSAQFTGIDPEGEDLTLEVDGLPPGASLNPVQGIEQASPFATTLSWTPTLSDIGVTYDVTIRFQDRFDATAEFSFSLTASIDTNQAPTIAPIASQTIECVNGQHLVTVATTVDDGDDAFLTVTWTVDGVLEQTDENVEAGDEVSFEFDYPHGPHAVVATVSDGAASASTDATVTVQDTKDPIIAVAADVTVATDPGKVYASGVVLQSPTASDASGHPVTLTNDAPSLYFIGQTTVTWTAIDESGNDVSATQQVIVLDKEAPVITPLPDVQANCDPGQKYATIDLPPPSVSDNAPGVTVTNGGRTIFPLGTSWVLWTATDASGNQAIWTQTVTIANRKPRARAGRNIVVTATSDRGVRVKLDGSQSLDRDQHKLKYFWRAKGVRLSPKRRPRTSGVFPIGTTVVRLIVTDAAGARHSDLVRVTVKLKNGRPRSQGSDANRSFELAAQQAGNGVASGAGSEAALAGLAYAQAASAFGDAAGPSVRWEEGQSETDAAASYAELRALQAAYGEAATQALLSAFAETGDESLFAAYGYAVYGTAYAAADLSER